MCKLMASAGRFKTLEPSERIKFHEFMSNLFEHTRYDGRDQDAAGFYAYAGDRTHHARQAGDFRQLEQQNREWELMRENPCSLYMCHARGAMSDASNPDNNHPFVGERIALMHEGWISNHKEHAVARGLTLTSETDSEFYMRWSDQRGLWLNKQGNFDPVRCMNALLAITDEPTALCFIDHSSEHPHIWFGMNKNEGQHPFAFYHIPRFKGTFLVPTEELMVIVGVMTFDLPYKEIERIPIEVKPFVTYKMDLLHPNITIYKP